MNILSDMATGRWFTAGSLGTATKAGLAQTYSGNICYLIPFVLGKAMTLSDLAVQPTAAGSALSVGKFAIYTSHSSTYLPETLVYDGIADTVLLDGSGVRSVTLGTPLALAAGIYWIGFIMNSSTTVTISGRENQSMFLPIGTSAINASNAGVSFAHTYGAMPATAPATSDISNTIFIAIGMKYS